MKNGFERAARNLLNSSYVVPIMLCAIGSFAISISLMIQDFYTSLWGYRALPTSPNFPLVDYAVAAVPQVVQIFVGYIAIAYALDREGNEDEQKPWIFAIIAITMLIVDVATDSFYRVLENPTMEYIWLIAIAESVVIFTLGSEVLFAASFGFLYACGKPGFAKLGNFFEDLISTIVSIMLRFILAIYTAFDGVMKLLTNKGLGGDSRKTSKPAQKPQMQNPASSGRSQLPKDTKSATRTSSTFHFPDDDDLRRR